MELLGGHPYSAEIRIVTKDGQVRWLSDVARPVWDAEQKRVVCIYGAGEDITDRKRSEEERAQLIREQAARAEAEASERRYRSLAEAIPQIVWTARPDGHVDYFNRRWFEYTGLSEAESRGRDAWRAAIHDDDADKHRERWATLRRERQRFRDGMPASAARRTGRIAGILCRADSVARP